MQSPSRRRNTSSSSDDEGRRFPGNGATLSGISSLLPPSRSGRKQKIGNTQQYMASLFFLLTTVSFWITIINFQKAHTFNNNVGGDAPLQANKVKIATAIQRTPIGNLGPSNTNRKHYRYYDSLFYTAMQYGINAKTSLEVGCSSDPFLKYLDWIEKRTCVAPYYVEYGVAGNPNHDSNKYANTKLSTGNNAITSVVADFMEYKLPNNQKYDLLLCSQVLEHVPNPSSFMKKLIESAATSIISVPYRWENCGSNCNHVTHRIDEKTLLEWSSPHVPIYSGIIAEGKVEGKFDRRIILVFKTTETNNHVNLKTNKTDEEKKIELHHLNIRQEMSKVEGV